MPRNTGIKVVALVGLLGMSWALFSACVTGVSQEELDALKQQLAAKEQEASGAKQEVATLKRQAEQVSTRAPWAAVPNAPPRPTPVPLPPGAVPPPPPQPPAAKVVPLFFYVDTVTAAGGESKYNVDASVGCVRTSIFKRGMRIVWRMEVVDTSIGKVLQAADVERAVLKLPHGENLDLRYGRHGRTEDAPWFWSTGWDVPMDYPLGYIDYSIEVTTKTGKVGTFKELTIPAAFAAAITTDRGGRETVTAGLMLVE